MKKICLLGLLLVFLTPFLTGCKTSHSGSREYVPGKGWIYTD